MRRYIALISLVVALALGLASVSLSAYEANKEAANSQLLRTLLLDGKTASAKSSKTTEREVTLLLQQQATDHTQTAAAQKELTVVVDEIETKIEQHIDATIRSIAESYYGAPK